MSTRLSSSVFRPRVPKHPQIIWLTAAYLIVLGLVLYPGLHERFAAPIMLWNSIPPTIALILVINALGKSARRMIVCAVFGFISVGVSLFFVAAWCFTPLDTDPHSALTILVFIYAPALSLASGTIVAAVAWFSSRTGAKQPVV